MAAKINQYKGTMKDLIELQLFNNFYNISGIVT